MVPIFLGQIVQPYKVIKKIYILNSNYKIFRNIITKS